MPESQQPQEGIAIMRSKILACRPKRVVDVGAGDGKWGQILHHLVDEIVAIEVWQPYVDKYNLRSIYDAVVCTDVRKWYGWKAGDVIIMGDVLEHMTRRDALALVRGCRAFGTVFLTIPTTPCPQDGEVYGNPYETHVDQWTHEELIAEGWELLHQGPNPKRLAMIGTYVMRRALPK